MDLFEYAEKANKQEEKVEEESRKIYAVGELTTEIKHLLKQSYGIKKIWVKGEVSNYRGRHQSGHMYFKLKDEQAVLTCVFFRSANTKLKFDLNEGMEIVVGGRIDLWEKGGNYQFTIEEVMPAGIGELHLRFEQLKKKLQQEGLFDQNRKQALPQSVESIGVVTSATGAVIRDIIHVVRRRCPYVKILLYPVSVQGENAQHEISQAITWFNQVASEQVDVLIVGRGGGSMEDLWAFNEEKVARAISESKIPIISAVGHQTDFTVADFVSDQRAATPSQAAELAVPDMMSFYEEAEALMHAMLDYIVLKKNHLSERLQRVLKARVLKDPYQLLGMKVQQLDLLKERLIQLGKENVRDKKRFFEHHPIKLKLLLEQCIQPKKALFQNLAGQLSALNPLAILERGYSVVKNQHGSIVSKTQGLKNQDILQVKLFKGEFECQVTKIKNSN
ncbi:MAG TPA: exodeoxyribonuclease VII large subunit [Oligoflexia bacterium]|nr:exodeoxyribonuclease VII large subunit [Oligoflexia bacterium]HMR24980.1 exodeoxyribonuclease VII large subunit [Oligoflexia bacterium]